MNGVDFSNKINRQNEIYRRNLSDQSKSHDAEVENLKKTHEYRENKQKDVHGKSLLSLEDSHKNTTKRINEDQKKALLDKSSQYDEAVYKQKREFHNEKGDNIRNWNKKFSELKDSFSKNLADTKENDFKMRSELDKNYQDSVQNIRKVASKDLDAYVETTKKGKKESDIQFRIEKNAIIDKNQTDKRDLIQQEIGKRNFLQKNAVKDVADSRELQDSRYIASKNEQETNLKNLTRDVNDRIKNEIIDREDRLISKNVDENKKSNISFSERFDDLARKYNKDVRNIEYRKRAEDISNGETSKKIQDKYKENMQAQVDLQRETQMNERLDVEKSYSNRLRDTVSSFQDSLRENNIESGEKISRIEADLTAVNRKDKFSDRRARERMSHDHQVSMKFAAEKTAIKEANQDKSTNIKVRALKENFNKSMEEARINSQYTAEISRNAMLEDKRVLEERLHEQNSKQNSFIKDTYNEKIAKLSEGYENRINQLELQNEVLHANANDSIKDIVRKTNFEIERQRKASQIATATGIKTERALGEEKQEALREKIKNLETNFTKKMNTQTLSNRKKVKDVQFEMAQKLASEATRYQDIIDQNNKFMSREFQRLQLASDTERQRLITQYEDRIQQLQRVYKDKAIEVEQFNQLNQTNQTS
ncbi:MAG: hypothetical protein ACJAS4_000790 [Bacteriovoracaceae bacterium]|jgi:hypothetical protein